MHCINEAEARRHEDYLQQLVSAFLDEVSGNAQEGELYKNFVIQIRNSCANFVPKVAEAKINVVLASVRDT